MRVVIFEESKSLAARSRELRGRAEDVVALSRELRRHSAAFTECINEFLRLVHLRRGQIEPETQTGGHETMPLPSESPLVIGAVAGSSPT